MADTVHAKLHGNADVSRGLQTVGHFFLPRYFERRPEGPVIASRCMNSQMSCAVGTTIMSGLATCDCPPCMIYFTIIYQLTVGENLTFQRGSWWFHLCPVTSNWDILG